MSDLFLAIKSILDVGWEFMSSVDVPGLGIPFGYLFIGIFVAVLGLRVLGWALGLSATAASSDLGSVNVGARDRSLLRLPAHRK